MVSPLRSICVVDIPVTNLKYLPRHSVDFSSKKTCLKKCLSRIRSPQTSSVEIVSGRGTPAPPTSQTTKVVNVVSYRWYS